MGMLFIVSAPSGAGKTSLVNALIEKVSMLKISVSYTTRPKRAHEVDGENYHFVSEDTFKAMQSAGAFFESAVVFGHHYGTSEPWVRDRLSQSDVILEIDWQGAQQIHQSIAECCSIFILPPSMEVLHQRLSQRGSDSDAVIKHRMSKALDECHHANEYDYVVVNKDFDQAVEDLRHIILSQRLRQDRQYPMINQYLKIWE